MELQINTCFKNIQDFILSDIQNAQEQILIAVAWFTNKTIFNRLLEKLGNGIKVKLIVINDNINIRRFGVDFQKFVTAGGKLFFAEKNIPMHNKYIVIDNHIVITGSYNYTYLAENINNENVIRLSGAEDIINGFIDDFNEISSNLSSVLSVKEYLEENPPFTNVFAFSNYGIKDIYQQAIILQKNDNDEEAKELVDYIDSSSDFSEKDCNNYQIRNVIYRQWQRDNFADKIIVKNNLIFVKFRTIASGGCWICSPGTKRCWMLRDSMNKSSYLSPTKIKNICINNKTIIEEAKNGCIYYLDKDDKEDYSNNDCGYKVNEDKKMIDDNGNKVPVEFIKIEGKVEMTCEVYFEDNERAFSDKIVDFIEGKDCENKDNFWHCFEINLRLNREPLDY